MFNGALPAGAIDAAHVPLLLARAVWLVGLLSATGALVYRAFEAPTEAGRFPPVRAGVSRLIRASLAVACVGWAVWVVLQAATIAGATTSAAAMSALPPVFSRTLFGHVASAQIALLLLAWATLRLGSGLLRVLPALCALAAAALQVGHLHAWAMDGVSPLAGAVVLHLAAAAGWLGALLPLRLVVRAAPLPAAIAAVRRFSARATVMVLVLAVTALVQSLRMLGGIPGLFGATYGWVAMAKLLLFAALLALAWRNRFRLAPALAGPDPAAARVALARSIVVETAVGVAVVLAASVLTALPPGMHGQPVWPFTLRPRLPLSSGCLLALAEVAVGAVVVAAALLLRRFRLRALAAAAALAWLAVPRLVAALEPATPTGFYRSQTGFTAASIVDGAAMFAEHCARCHAGADPKLHLAAADGDVFWVISAGTAGMAGFAGTLDEDQRWHLIDFLRARAAVAAPPARAPDVELACPDAGIAALSDLRGQPVRLVFRPGADPVAGDCTVSDPDARAAYAIATGLAPEALSGTTLLIDPQGFLRAVPRPVADPAPTPPAGGRENVVRQAG